MSLEAYILVGGRSSRFAAGDKALAKFNGGTLAEHALETVRSAFPASKIFFIARDAVQFEQEAARLGTLYVYDIIENRGPLGGLYTALQNCSSEWIFLFASDMPLVTADLLKTLWDKRDDGVGVVLPEQPDGRLQPLCAFYNVANAGPVVEALIHRPGPPAAMMAAVDALKPRVIRPSEFDSVPDTVFSNVNTTEDLDTAVKIKRKLSGTGEI